MTWASSEDVMVCQQCNHQNRRSTWISNDMLVSTKMARPWAKQIGYISSWEEFTSLRTLHLTPLYTRAQVKVKKEPKMTFSWSPNTCNWSISGIAVKSCVSIVNSTPGIVLDGHGFKSFSDIFSFLRKLVCCDSSRILLLGRSFWRLLRSTLLPKMYMTLSNPSDFSEVGWPKP